MSLNVASGIFPVLRYCENCKAWFHLDCCPTSPTPSLFLQPPASDRPPQPSSFSQASDLISLRRVPFSLTDWLTWQEVLKLPIQRGHHAEAYPLSFECLVADIRKQHRFQGCPPDVDNWLLRHLHPAPHIAYTAHTLLTQFRAWEAPIPVQCPRCTNGI
ncbi:hypothetical protein BD414DRAFT_409506 [Trametes punicea]|nr:hypothetical protein BD414DRAFT_425025 [Trametes punicea]KAI8989933.1 hypothetical protein BD414DRAFT_414144 [Trametes punicea]KAI8995715.1 hypothetical protein BD414DRAFT_409506 [Trametes punicea]